MKVSVRQLSVLTLLWSLFVLSNGQAQVGNIRGKVTDEEGKPVKDVLIRIESMQSGGKYQVKTKKDGTYFHGGIRLQGSYRVIAQKKGYRSDGTQGIRPGFEPFDPRGKVDFVLVPGKSDKVAFELTEEEKQKIRQEKEEQEKREMLATAVRQDYNEGVEYFNAGQYELAVKAFEAALQKDDQQPGLWSNLALTYFNLKQIDKAIENYQKAISIAPDDPSLYKGLGDAYSEIKDYEKAKEAYEQSAGLAGDLDPTEAAGSYYNMGITFINNGRTKDAAEALKKAVEADPSHAEAHYQLGISLLSLSRIEEAIAHLKEYVELKPQGGNAEIAQQLVEQLQQ